MDDVVRVIRGRRETLRDLVRSFERQPRVTERVRGDQLRERQRVTDEIRRRFLDYLEFTERHLARTVPVASGPWPERLAGELVRETWWRPTRPHPDLPVRWGVAVAVRPVLGLVDHVIEATAFGPTGA